MSSNQAKSYTGHLWPDGSVCDLVRERRSAKQEKGKPNTNRQSRKKTSRNKIETSLTRKKNSVWEEKGHCQKLKTGRASVDVIFGAGKEVIDTAVFPLVILEGGMSGKQIPSL